MRCDLCGKDKLSREYPPDPLAQECNHPLRACMRCVVQYVNDNNQCPGESCSAHVSPDSISIQSIQRRLEYLFPTCYHVNDDPDIGDADDAGNIRVSTVTGDVAEVPYESTMTIDNLKIAVRKQTGHEESKQRLLFKGRGLEVYNEDGSLSRLKDYGIRANHTIHLVVLLLDVPRSLNHVTFDLSWGFPATGRDFLDASCFIFHGEEKYEVEDFRPNPDKDENSPVWHAGDEMDNAQKKGHQIINVKLKQLESTVTHLFFTLSAFESENLSPYKHPTLKFYDSSDKKKDLCSTSFHHAHDSQAVVMCCLSRRLGYWQIYNSGQLTEGNVRNYDPIVATIRSIIEEGV